MHGQTRPALIQRPEAITGLLQFEERTFDHLETASDLVLVTALYDAIDRIADWWLRVELDVIATVAAKRWSPDAFAKVVEP